MEITVPDNDHAPPPAQDPADVATGFLRRFAADFNQGRVDRMSAYYTGDFSAVVDAVFIGRDDYLSSVAALIAAGYSDLGFELHLCRGLPGGSFLADGTTRIVDPAGAETSSCFSILAEAAAGDLQFVHVHTSTPNPAGTVPLR